MIDIEKLTGNLTGYRYKKINTGKEFINIASGFAHEPGTTLLMSGGNLDCSRYHILGIRPWLTFSAKGEYITITCNNKDHRFKENPFNMLKIILNSCKIGEPPDSIPIASGLMGYLSYDLKDYLEDLPRTSIDDLNLPVIYLNIPSVIFTYDKITKEEVICAPERDGMPLLNLELAENLLKETTAEPAISSIGIKTSQGNYTSNFTQKDYEAAIVKIREYIASGHVYQVNMTQRFEMDFAGDPFDLFTRLYKKNPAPFFAYINAVDHHIVSTSPERFLNLKDDYIETRPIKGTKPRGNTNEQDESLRLQLENSKKDEAELSMIVDLMRNDIGKVCEASSVKVKEHKRLEAYENVYHLVSIVEGKLRKDCDEVDILKATFPGGSITGCPKIRAMEIIDELEPNRRHVYTGSTGYISFHRSMDLSIAIRTAIICNNRIYFSFGGGIVYDSDPPDEFRETLHKGKTIMETLKENKPEKNHEPVIWMNGSLKPLSEGNITINDLGMQYGYGFFETIRVDSGRILFLEDHIKRFNQSWNRLFKHPQPDLTWGEIIQQVIDANQLDNKTAAVKIMATYGDRDNPPHNHGLFVTARAYIHRLEGKSEKGLRLGIYPEPRQSPLADHKTLNYLYYYMAGKWAKEKGFDEAVILNADNSLSETNTANLLLIRKKRVIRPASQHKLEGILEKNVCKFLNANGYSIEEKKITINDLGPSDSLIMTNSLIGAVPVLSIDILEPEISLKLCEWINNSLLTI
ncbi:MAG: aminodeoxychorismate synthase component I [Deltaproteobacteria bacterium]|nr:aminodeoxychorismate synthase component I [Deltaproteobacteria bacterium]